MMFFNRKKDTITNVYSLLRADMHSHLLPGIDDGSPDMDTSLELIRGMAALGYEKLITTPHIMWDIYQNTAALIGEKLETLRARAVQEGIGIDIHAAAEYFIDDHLGEMVERKERLLSFGQNHVLVEFSMASRPLDWKKTLFDMQIQGYQPVIAHPERYSYLEQDKSFYQELRDTGCLFQLNILSLCGYYGKNVLDLARYLIKKDFYDLLGSDLHNVRHLSILRDPSLVSPLMRLVESGRIINPQL
jgi:protein-tyrosine phosphatase